MKREMLVKKLRKWLGKDGIKYFLDIKEKHGRIDAVWMEGPVPHCVHFIEGMQVRNFLRKHVKWDAIKLDDEWVGLVEEAINEG